MDPGSVRDGLTAKQIEYCAELVANGGDKTAAALKAGYSERSKYAAIQRLGQSPHVMAEIRRVAIAQGLTPERIMQTIGRGLDAKITREVAGETVEVPDTANQLRAAELGLRVHGVTSAPETQAVVGVNIMSEGWSASYTQWASSRGTSEKPDE